MPPSSSRLAPVQLSRRTVLVAALPAALLFGGVAQAQEKTALEKIRDSGILKVALYKENEPYSDGSMSHMSGLDVSLAAALASKLQLKPSYLPFDAGENMSDDLRNMVWKGHYLGYGPADVMLHVPVDKYFMGQNQQAFIFAPYTREHLVLLHNPKTVPNVSSPEDLTERRIAVEQGTGAASAMLGYRGGLVRERVSIYKSGMDAANAVLQAQADTAFITLAQAEAAVFQSKQNRKDWAFTQLAMPGVPPNGWAIGMAVKADNKDLALLLDKALDELRSSGELLRIFQEHGLTLAAP